MKRCLKDKTTCEQRQIDASKTNILTLRTRHIHVARHLQHNNVHDECLMHTYLYEMPLTSNSVTVHVYTRTIQQASSDVNHSLLKSIRDIKGLRSSSVVVMNNRGEHGCSILQRGRDESEIHV